MNQHNNIIFKLSSKIISYMAHQWQSSEWKRAQRAGQNKSQPFGHVV